MVVQENSIREGKFTALWDEWEVYFEKILSFLIGVMMIVAVAFAGSVDGRYDALMTEKTWNAVDATNSGYAPADDFLAYTRETIQRIESL